jgi:hypothetical protein
MRQYICDECKKAYKVNIYYLHGAFHSKGGILLPEDEKHFCGRTCFNEWIIDYIQIAYAIEIKYKKM